MDEMLEDLLELSEAEAESSEDEEEGGVGSAKGTGRALVVVGTEGALDGSTEARDEIIWKKSNKHFNSCGNLTC